MASFKAKQPRANPPIFWGCDRALFAGGRIYELVDGHPYHKGCVPTPEPKSDPEAIAKATALNGWKVF